jgi:hypothetical protein
MEAHLILSVNGPDSLVIKFTIPSECSQNHRSLVIARLPRGGVLKYQRPDLQRESSKSQRRRRELAPLHLQLIKLALVNLSVLRRRHVDYGISDFAIVQGGARN